MTISPNKYPTEIFGHHGFSRVYPENTLIGFQKAIGLGVDGIELDIVVNKDLDLVFFMNHTWKVNDIEEKKLLKIVINGIITDYPNLMLAK